MHGKTPFISILHLSPSIPGSSSQTPITNLHQLRSTHPGLLYPAGLTNPSWSASAIGPADLFGFSLLALLAAPGTPQRLAVGSPYFGRDDAEQMRPGKVHVFAPRRHCTVTVAEAEAVGWEKILGILGFRVGQLRKEQI